MCQSFSYMSLRWLADSRPSLYFSATDNEMQVIMQGDQEGEVGFHGGNPTACFTSLLPSVNIEQANKRLKSK